MPALRSRQLCLNSQLLAAAHITTISHATELRLAMSQTNSCLFHWMASDADAGDDLIHHIPLLKHGVTCGVCAAGYYTECQAAQHTSNACRPGALQAELASLCHNLWQLLLGAGGVHQERPEPAHCRPCTLPGTSKKYFC